MFSSKGFHAARVDAIAEKAGVGKGTIYEYFKSKSHVFEEMYKWYVEEYFRKMEAGLVKEAPAGDKLGMMIKNHIIFVRSFKSLAGKMLSETTSHIDLGSDFKKMMIATYREKMERIKGIIEEGIKKGLFREIDSELCTIFFFGSLGGISHAMFLLDMEIEPEEVAEKLLDLLLRGIENVQ